MQKASKDIPLLKPKQPQHRNRPEIPACLCLQPDEHELKLVERKKQLLEDLKPSTASVSKVCIEKCAPAAACDVQCCCKYALANTICAVDVDHERAFVQLGNTLATCCACRINQSVRYSWHRTLLMLGIRSTCRTT
jgi:hypothetical protein